jgi:hypothetical protein
LHLCAEFGQTECFKKFMELGHMIDVTNEVIDVYLIIYRQMNYQYILLAERDV